MATVWPGVILQTQFQPAIPQTLDLTIGVAIRKTADGFHTGILYRAATGIIRFIHLAWHMSLIDQEMRSYEYLWASASWLHPEDAEVLAAFSSRLKVHANVLPYSVHYQPGVLRDATGDYDAPDPGYGLTCATFVMEVFRAFGFPILDWQQWPKRSGDEPWKSYVISMMEKHGAPAEHIQAVRDTEVQTRFAPPEVAWAVASSSKHPAPFATTELLGMVLTSDLVCFSNATKN